MKSVLNKEFWTGRWAEGNTGWDIGFAAPAITEFAEKLENKDLEILIPGAGNAYEAEWLWDHGFKNIHVIDIAQIPLDKLKARCPGFPLENMHCVDFFLHEGQYDLILEQTFFSALDPSLRNGYARKIQGLLKPGGELVGVLFDFIKNDENGIPVGPPFGGTRDEYTRTFSPYFDILKLEPCVNSIGPRMGRELFIRFKSK